MTVYGQYVASGTPITLPALAVIGGNIMQSNSAGSNILSGATIIGTTAAFAPLDKIRLYVGGGMMFVPTIPGRPTCSVTYRGAIWYTQSSTSADTISACMKTASSTYAWKDL